MSNIKDQILSVICTLDNLEVKIAGLKAIVVANSGNPDTARDCMVAMRETLEDCAPHGGFQYGLTTNFDALREGHGAAVTAYYDARENAGLPRYTTP